MKVGDLVRQVHSPEAGMTGIIVEIVAWEHTESTTPFILWDDGGVRKIQQGLIEVVNENR